MSTVYKIDFINKNQFILKVKSKLVAQKIKIGQICKVQGYKNFHKKPIVLTCVSVSDDIISFVITKKMTIHTAKIFNMKPGDKIALLGPIGNHIPDNYKNYTFIIDNEYKMVANEIIKQKPFTNAKIISHDDIGTKMNPDCIILWTDKIVDIKSVYKSSDIYIFMTKNMHCMMGGICGKCMYKDQNQNTQFGCNNHIIKI